MSGTKGHSGGARNGAGAKKKPLNSPCRVCGRTERYKSGECKACGIRRTKARHKLLQATSEEYRAANKERRKKNYPKKKIVNRRRQLEILYGLSLADYEVMLSAQDHSCFICKKPQSELKYALAVDHCHKTNKVRSLLCPTCNNAVAMYENYGEQVKQYLDIFK